MPAAVCLIRSRNAAGELVARLGVLLLDEYLEFLGGRCRPNTVLVVAYDLKVFFTVVRKPPRQVRPAGVEGHPSLMASLVVGVDNAQAAQRVLPAAGRGNSKMPGGGSNDCHGAHSETYGRGIVLVCPGLHRVRRYVLRQGAGQEGIF